MKIWESVSESLLGQRKIIPQRVKTLRKLERESHFPNGLSPFYNEDLCMDGYVANLGLMYRTCVTMHESLVLCVPNFNRLHMLKENCSCIHFV